MYFYTIHDSSTGHVLCEAPFTGVQFSRVLSDAGSFTGQIPTWHPAATEANVGLDRNNSDREVVVWRNGVAVWAGPITGCEVTLSGDTFTVTAREAVWHLMKRILEVNKNYNATDVFDAARDLFSYGTSKTASGSDGMTAGASIVASIPRFAVSPASTDAGATITDSSPPTFYGSARHSIFECFVKLALDPETGFEWRNDVSSTSLQAVTRTVTLGYPSLGSTLTAQLTEANLLDADRAGDWERAATRVHVLYNGGVITRQSSAAVTAGVLLSEKVEDLSDTSKSSVATSYAKDLRRLSRPPVQVPGFAWVPSTSGLAFDFCNLGDVVPYQITSPNIMSISVNSRRVVQLDYTPGDDGLETVKATCNSPLTDLST